MFQNTNNLLIRHRVLMGKVENIEGLLGFFFSKHPCGSERSRLEVPQLARKCIGSNGKRWQGRWDFSARLAANRTDGEALRGRKNCPRDDLPPQRSY